MLDVSRDIRSLSDFKRKTRSFLEQLREEGRILILTVNGKAELVVMNTATFQALQKELDDLQAGRS